MLAKNTGSRPSDFWGFEDPIIAWDIDRLCNIRLMFHEAEVAKRQADAMKGEREPEMPSLFTSNETGQFGPQVEN
jgi:hypothetical protein